jgi:hypothetical protein
MEVHCERSRGFYAALSSTESRCVLLLKATPSQQLLSENRQRKETLMLVEGGKSKC